MMKYFDDFIGKGLGAEVFAELIMYFSINMTPIAFPLAVLLSSLMTFGNLGEHFELTAIKSAGISLIRALRPLFVFVILLTGLVYYSNNYIVPKANLNAFSLLYDIKQKKPSIDIKEGAFYNGIPGYSIKANTKYNDVSLGDLIIYNHSQGRGNQDVIIADSALMYTILNDSYLVMELFNGKQYTEGSKQQNKKDHPGDYTRNSFYHNKVVFSLADLALKRTDKELFSSNRLMKNEGELRYDVDSMQTDILQAKRNLFRYSPRFFTIHLQDEILDVKPESVIAYEKKVLKKDTVDVPTNSREQSRRSRQEEKLIADKSELMVQNDVRKRDSRLKKQNIKLESDSILLQRDSISESESQYASTADSLLDAGSFDSTLIARIDSVFEVTNKSAKINLVDKARFSKNRLKGENRTIERRDFESNVYAIEANSKLSQAVACLVMFLIGAPLGAIIKKGGLGFPVLISIVFFIISYVINTSGIKLGREGELDVYTAVWASNIILLPFGLYFLRQARNDSRLLELDTYTSFFRRIFKKK
jgi:lipopolysaccharide export system permease protein